MYTALLVRPGETDFDREGRIQGALDLPLTPEGRRQVAQIIDQLRAARPTIIYTSPSQPARATSELIADALGVPLRELPGLSNVDQGLWQGMLLSDLRRKHPRVYRQWQEYPESVCPPAGETCDAVVDRVERALRKPMKRSGAFAVVVAEPLAAIVRSVLQGEHVPRIPGPPAGSSSVGTVEVVDTQHADETVLLTGSDTDLPLGASDPTKTRSIW